MRKFNALKYLLAVSIVVGAVFTAVSCDIKKDEEEGHTHTFGDWVETEATCTEKGTMTRVCKECQQSEDHVTSEALGHDIVNYSAKNPTCTEDGYAAYEICLRCDYTTYSKINATGHTLEARAEKTPTCEENGYEAHEGCVNCSYTTAHNVIPAQHNFQDGVCTECQKEACDVHSFGDWYGTEATCELPGRKYQKCDVCGFVVSKDTAATGHSIVRIDAKAATCTEHGYEAYEYCKNCSYTTYEEIPAAHKFEGGKCTVCGADQCTEHEYGSYYGNTATCKAGGEEYRECTKCGHIDSRATAKTSHKYENKVCIWCGAKDYTLPPQPLGAKKDD